MMVVTFHTVYIATDRTAMCAAFTSSAPPSPLTTFLVSWKLMQPRSPTAPRKRPL